MSTKLTKEIHAKFNRRRIIGIALGTFAIIAPTLSLARPAYSAVNCKTRVLNTVAVAECTGTGVWRLRVDCQYEPDWVGKWKSAPNVKTDRGECTFRARGATIETR